MKRLLWLVLFWTSLASAQVVGPGFVDYVTSAPSGACSQGQHMQQVLGSGDIYTCANGTWTKQNGGGGGGTPGGSSANIQYNNVGAFGGSATNISSGGLITFPSAIGGAVGGADALDVALPEAVASIWDWSFEDGGVQTGNGHHDWASQFGYNVLNNTTKKATESAVYWGLETNFEQTGGDPTTAQSEWYLTAITPNAAGGGPVGGALTDRVIFGTQTKLNGQVKLHLKADFLDIQTNLGSAFDLILPGGLNMPNAGQLIWQNVAISDIGTGSLAIGLGSAGDTTGNLSLSTLSNVNGIGLTIGDGGVNSNIVVRQNINLPNNGNVNFTAGSGLLWGAAGVSNTGLTRLGNASVALGNGTASDRTGALTLQTLTGGNSTTPIVLELAPSFTTFGGLWLGQTTPSITNYAIVSDGTDTAVNAITGKTVALRINNANKVVVAADGTLQLGASADVGFSRTAAATVALGNGTASDATGTLKGAAFIANTANASAQLVAEALPASPGSFAGLWFGQTTPGTGNYSVLGSTTETDLNSPTGGAVNFRINNTGVASVTSTGLSSSNLTATSAVSGATYLSATRCAATGTAASPSVASCAAASAGAFSCATNASAATCTVNTTAVTANSTIIVQESAAEGTPIGVTCNTAPTVTPAILLSAKVAATSFTINMPTITVNPACFVYWIVN